MNETTAIQVQEQAGPVELATTQAAEMARARIESQYLVALKRPRNEDVALQRMLRECKRPAFSDVAIYSLPIGGQQIEGYSIRFAEAVARVWGNLSIEQTITFDDGKKRIVRVSATDLESNATHTGEVVVELVVRRKYAGDRTPIGVSRNSKGEQTYLLQADERDAAQLTASAASKALRTAVLRLIPGWVLDECWAQLDATARNKSAEDPDEQRRKIVAAFGDLNVPADQLADFLGHDIGTSSPAEIVQLKRTYAAIRDGETTWADVMGAKGKEAPKSDPNAALKDKLRGYAKKPKGMAAKPPAPKPAEPPPDAGDAWAPPPDDEPPPAG